MSYKVKTSDEIQAIHDCLTVEEKSYLNFTIFFYINSQSPAVGDIEYYIIGDAKGIEYFTVDAVTGDVSVKKDLRNDATNQQTYQVTLNYISSCRMMNIMLAYIQ